MAIRNLLFDLGGVIIDLNRQRCIDTFRRMGFADIGDFLGEYVQKGIFSQLESGLITPAQWRAEMHRHLPPTVSDDDIDRAFESFLAGIPRRRLEALRDLAGRYDIYLLSNTNEVMWHGRIAEEFRAEGLTMTDYFKGIVTSFEARAMKPDPAIFRYTVDKLAIDPAETLFLDDSQSNLDSAATLGFRTALVAPGSEFSDIIASHEHH